MKKQNLVRQERLEIRLTRSEKEYIQDKADFSNKSLSEFCREALINTVVIKREMTDVIEVLTQLNRIGNNINQIAKAIHMNGDKVMRDDYIEVRTQVEEMKYLIIEKVYQSAYEYERRLENRDDYIVEDVDTLGDEENSNDKVVSDNWQDPNDFADEYL